MHDRAERRAVAPIVATVLALAYPAAVAAGAGALAVLTVAAAVSGCALVLARRSSLRLRVALAAIAVWLAGALGGAFLLSHHALRGFAWVLVALYAVPLPLVPWIYARTFAGSTVRRFEGPEPGGEQRSGGAEEQRGATP
ncbi:MAG TPA: hypothetical protein VMT19_05430 [Thermoanaerobaculaceae bacterium]|nr:hypothetical protein [Thermoanaerobaculaceae bacterium]